MKNSRGSTTKKWREGYPYYLGQIEKNHGLCNNRMNRLEQITYKLFQWFWTLVLHFKSCEDGFCQQERSQKFLDTDEMSAWANINQALTMQYWNMFQIIFCIVFNEWWIGLQINVIHGNLFGNTHNQSLSARYMDLP